MSEENFILYEWNYETKEFWFLGEKIDYVHNPTEWRKYLNNLVKENQKLKEKNKIYKNQRTRWANRSHKLATKCDKYKLVLDEIREYINKKTWYPTTGDEVCFEKILELTDKDLDDLLQILDKVGE